MGFLSGVHRQCEGSYLAVAIDIEPICVLFGITSGCHILCRFCLVCGQLFRLLIANRRFRYKSPVGNLSVSAAKVRLKGIVIQRVGNRLPEIFVHKQPLCIVECQHSRGIGRSHIDQGNTVIAGQDILIGSRDTGRIAPNHVYIALLQCQIHGILIAEKAIDDLLYIGFLRIVGVDREGEGPGLFAERIQNIRATGDACLLFGYAFLSFVNMFRHHAERGHVA